MHHNQARIQTVTGVTVVTGPRPKGGPGGPGWALKGPQRGPRVAQEVAGEGAQEGRGSCMESSKEDFEGPRKGPMGGLGRSSKGSPGSMKKKPK
jgi:hypothetical protein